MTNLHDLIDALRAGKVWEPAFKQTIKNVFPKISSWILEQASSAVCFDFGDANGVPDFPIVSDLVRMPYRVTWFEGKASDGIVGVLACEVGEGVWHVAVFNKRLGVAWQLVCVVEVICTEDDLWCKTLAMLGPTESANNAAHKYATGACNLVARFVMALNCVNVKKVEHPAPKSINERRAAKGKQPLFSFWTLHLPASRAKDGPALGGTHASPRVHLRRGHIRQYAPGKYTWVEACVVGNKQAGMVAKDYSFTAEVTP